MDLKEFISERFTDIKDTMKANKEELKGDINSLRADFKNCGADCDGRLSKLETFQTEVKIEDKTLRELAKETKIEKQEVKKDWFSISALIISGIASAIAFFKH